jgi:glutamate-1-semialdehyde 2,1-aminomutase
LSWIGTGRLIFSLDYGDAEVDAVLERFVAAAKQMRADGWWWEGAPHSDKQIRRGILKELLRRRLNLA